MVKWGIKYQHKKREEYKYNKGSRGKRLDSKAREDLKRKSLFVIQTTHQTY